MRASRLRTAYFVDGRGPKLARLWILLGLAVVLAATGSWHTGHRTVHADTDGTADVPAHDDVLTTTPQRPFAS